MASPSLPDISRRGASIAYKNIRVWRYLNVGVGCAWASQKSATEVLRATFTALIVPSTTPIRGAELPMGSSNSQKGRNRMTIGDLCHTPCPVGTLLSS